MDDTQSLSHAKWECKYHIVWIPKYRRKLLYGRIRKHLGEVIHGLARQKETRYWKGILCLNFISLLVVKRFKQGRNVPLSYVTLF